jgi:hypothetical protein
MSIWVYAPSQAKYRPIFSPKYFLRHTQTGTSLVPPQTTGNLSLC